jgi:hypothetical protein
MLQRYVRRNSIASCGSVRALPEAAALRHKGQINWIRFDKFRSSGCQVTRHADDFPFSSRHSSAHILLSGVEDSHRQHIFTTPTQLCRCFIARHG